MMLVEKLADLECQSSESSLLAASQIFFRAL